MMINYIKSENYRVFRDKWLYLGLIALMALGIFANVILHFFSVSTTDFPYGNTRFSLSSLYGDMKIALFICLPLVQAVINPDFRAHTLKNTVSYGTKRSDIYLGKFLVSLLISLIYYVCISAAFIISGKLLLVDSGNIYLVFTIRTLIAGAPLCICAAAAAHCLTFAIDNPSRAAIMWIILLFIIPIIFAMLGGRIPVLMTIARYSPYFILSDIQFIEGQPLPSALWATTSGLAQCFIVGIVGTIIFYIAGLMAFKNREIK